MNRVVSFILILLLMLAILMNVMTRRPPRTSADFDGDGRSDYAIAEPGGSVRVVLSGRRNSQRYRQKILSPFMLMAADWNGDGRTDLIVVDMRGQSTVLFGDGRGVFKPQDGAD